MPSRFNTYWVLRNFMEQRKIYSRKYQFQLRPTTWYEMPKDKLRKISYGLGIIALLLTALQVTMKIMRELLFWTFKIS